MLDPTLDRIAELLQEEGVPYVVAWRAARRILELAPERIVVKTPTKHLTTEEVERNQA